MSILEKIRGPADLAGLDRPAIEKLAAEVRELIISTVAANGGHLASNLGVVELTIALLKVFNQPEDRIVWDVGHQCYTHKILTGRREAFAGLRTDDGLSGFPKRSESPHDAFDTGHGGTSISVAGGLREGGWHRKSGGRLVAVIGDGSMTSGMAFEGLNHLGQIRRQLVVVLNDNEMSISPNVGALSTYLNRLMTGHVSTRLREETQKFLQGLPGGDSMLRIARRAEESMKALVTPGMIFEELGFKYVGPIPGHEIESLLTTFRNVREYDRPILVHVVTRKGKGYEPAERNPSLFHGIGPFDRATGEPRRGEGPPTYTEVFGRTLVEMAEGDDRLVAVTAAMCDGTGLVEFARRFPTRFYDVGIAEEHAVTFAAGLAAAGMKPVVAIYSTFMQRAYDQVVHDVCLPGLPVILALDRAGIVGEDGPTHQGVFDLSFLRHLPGMTVMAPRDEEELRRMLVTAASLAGPVAIRYPRGRGVGVPLADAVGRIEPGRAEVLRQGGDLAIVALGSTVHPSLVAAGELAAEGIEAMVIDARFVKPLDREALALAARTGRVLTVEENVLEGGFGSAVLEALAEAGLAGVTFRRLGIPDVFVEHGRPATLRRRYGLDAAGIAAAARALVGR
jgi:1-deoxy-D-xylulose-5-phosphate synthase